MKELLETTSSELQILEESQNNSGPWRVKGTGLTVDVINENRRKYPTTVALKAVGDAQRRIDEGENVTGQIEHPTNPSGHLAETVFNWKKIGLENGSIALEGLLLGTRAGRDLREMAKGGVKITLSQRAKGDTVSRSDHNEVTNFTILGYDAAIAPSDRKAAIRLLESKQESNQSKGVSQMSDISIQINEFIEAQAGTYARFDESTRSKLAKAVKAQKPESFDEAKRLLEQQAGDYDAILENAKASQKALLERQQQELAELQQEKNRREVEAFLEESVKEAKYPKAIKEAYLNACKAVKPANLEEAQKVLEEQRSIFDPLAASQTLAGKGFNRVQVMGPVIEKETGYPEYARVSFVLGQRLEESAQGRVRNFQKPQNQAEKLTAKLLERFDQHYQNQLLNEARLYEAETTSDLAIPFSAIRAVMAEAYPALVAAMVFDFAAANNDPEKIGYEVFTGESGYTVSVTDEDFNSGAFSTVDGLSQGDWVDLANKALVPGTVVVNVDGGGALITDDGTNYVVDYAKGRIKMLDGGSSDADVAASTAYEIDYDYNAIGKGENATIERAKVTLNWKTLSANPFRLATMITDEAIVYGQSQAGWDAVTRTIASLAREVQKQIDTWIFYLSLSGSHSVANNLAATVNINATTGPDDLIEAVGKAKVKVINRGYEPTAVVCSATIADIMSNSDRFSQSGNRPGDALEANGFVGRAKGLPVYEVAGSQYTDSWMQVVNREHVIHRVFRPMEIKGPFQVNDATSAELIPAEEYYIQEYNGSDVPVPAKSSHVKLTTS